MNISLWGRVCGSHCTVTYNTVPSIHTETHTFKTTSICHTKGVVNNYGWGGGGEIGGL